MRFASHTCMVLRSRTYPPALRCPDLISARTVYPYPKTSKRLDDPVQHRLRCCCLCSMRFVRFSTSSTAGPSIARCLLALLWLVVLPSSSTQASSSHLASVYDITLAPYTSSYHSVTLTPPISPHVHPDQQGILTFTSVLTCCPVDVMF